MNTATATDVSWLESFQTEWRSLRACRHNVLLEGSLAATNAVLRLLQPHIGGLLAWLGGRGSRTQIAHAGATSPSIAALVA